MLNFLKLYRNYSRIFFKQKMDLSKFLNNTLFSNKETFIFLIFILGTLLVEKTSLYFIFLLFLWGLSLYFFKDLVKATWVVFLLTLFFIRGKVFYSFQLQSYMVPAGVAADKFIFQILFSDFFLCSLIYILIRSSIIQHKQWLLHFNFKDLFLLLFLLIGIIASWNSTMPLLAWWNLFQVFKYISIFYVAKIIYKYMNFSLLTLKLFLLFFLLNSYLIIFQKINGGQLGLSIESNLFGRFADEAVSLYRPGGISWDPNLIASYLSLFLPGIFFLYTFKFKHNMSKFWINQLFYVGNIALIFTASRAAWAATFLFYVLLFIYNKKYLHFPVKKFIRLNYQKIILLFLLFFLPFIYHRFSQLYLTYVKTGGFVYRLNHLSMAYDFAKQRLCGIGFNIFQYQILFNYHPKKYFYDIAPAHNIFAQILSGVGFIGLACWLIFYSFTLKSGLQKIINYKKQIKNDNNLVHNLFNLTIIFSFVCISQFYPWFFSPLLAPIFWLYLGAVYAQKN